MPDTPPLLSSPLVSTEWLAQHLHHPRVKPVDASWHLPTQPQAPGSTRAGLTSTSSNATQRNAAAEFRNCHIPGAVFFDIDAHSLHPSPLPHMLPDTACFTRAMQQLGINADDSVIVYDSTGLFSAARLWWMLRVFGHTQVAVLDGGLPCWQAAQLPVTQGEPDITSGNFTAQLPNPALLSHKDALLENLHRPQALVLDARSAARFSGTVAEPRAGLRSGHIPHSINLPYTSLLQPDGRLKPREELQSLLAVAQGREVISSCGSGITACIIDLALETIGHRHHAVYDGSWAEWGATESGCPVSTD